MTFLLVAIVFLSFVLVYQALLMAKAYSLIVKARQAMHDNAIAESNRRVTMWAAMMVLTMILAAKDHDEDQFIHLRNRLHFFGVPDEILDDSEKLKEFMNDCIENKYDVVDGSSPFSYRFIRKEEK